MSGKKDYSSALDALGMEDSKNLQIFMNEKEKVQVFIDTPTPMNLHDNEHRGGTDMAAAFHNMLKNYPKEKVQVFIEEKEKVQVFIDTPTSMNLHDDEHRGGTDMAAAFDKMLEKYPDDMKNKIIMVFTDEPVGP